jgi:hypothetical protein
MVEAKYPPRIMYIERKEDGSSRIGRVTFSRTGTTIYYGGKSFGKISGFKSNYMDEETRAEYWISGPKRNGEDRLYASNIPIEIDEDAREEYWTTIRKKPELKDSSTTIGGKSRV